MPQLYQLSDVLLSQLFWLAIALGFIFFVIARGMVPKIQATVDAREQRIARDLEAAQGARAAADETEAKVKAVADKLGKKVEAAEAKIRQAREAARTEIEAVAAEATSEMVARLTGIAVDPKAATAAVKAELNV